MDKERDAIAHQRGTIAIDNLHYKYDNDNNSNKLLNVTDETSHPDGFNDGNVHTKTNEDDFEYDDFGNLIVDRNKKINEITYNHLNLPKKIVFETGEISYLYDATGVKLKKTVTDGNTSQITNTHYSEGFQYTEDHLDFFPHAEGYVNVIDYSAFNYVYTYKDHLGNIRLKYTLDPDTNETAILEENHYYPYGLTHQGYNADHKFFIAINEIIELVEVTSIMDDKYKYKYNGKEFQDELNFNVLDYGARNYDPAVGRWNRIDNKAEIYYALSPYNYAGNTPVQAIDVDGNLFIFVNGFMMNQWMAGQRPEYINIAYDSKHRVMSKNPHYSKYAPDRGFYKDGARNNGKTFRYWTFTSPSGKDEGVNLLYQRAYGDHNAYYTNGSFTPKSTAKTRFAEGAKAAADLIEKLESGDISLADGETIKIVGHSQGAAYAAGLATELLKHSVYGSRIEFVDYIAAHQPTDFESPKGLLSRQFLTWSDWVVDGIMSDLGLNGGSENGCIKNVTDCQERKSHRDGRGGHSVNTYLDYIADYFRSLGINVTVK